MKLLSERENTELIELTERKKSNEGIQITISIKP